MDYIGKTIRIIDLADEPAESMKRYAGKTGVVERVSKDPWGDLALHGTWGGIAIYPDKDTIEILD